MNNRNLKQLRPAIGLLAGVTAFGVAALGAPVVLGQSPDDHVPDEGGPVTPRMVVASGTARHFGRWELVSSQNANGDPCIGVRLVGSSDAADGASLAEGCGGAASNQVGTLVASSGGTLFFGRVDARAARARVSDGGRDALVARTIAGRDGRRYVLAESDGKLGQAQVRLEDAQGRDLGRADPAAAAD